MYLIHFYSPFHHPKLLLWDSFTLLCCPAYPDQYTVLQAGPQEGRVRRDYHLLHPTGRSTYYAAQDTADLSVGKHTLMFHIKFLIYQAPQVFLSRATLKEYLSQSLYIPAITVTQVENLALCFVEPH